MKARFAILQLQQGAPILVFDEVCWLKGRQFGRGNVRDYLLENQARSPKNVAEVIPAIDELISLYDHVPDSEYSHNEEMSCVRVCKHCKKIFTFHKQDTGISIPESIYQSCQ